MLLCNVTEFTTFQSPWKSENYFFHFTRRGGLLLFNTLTGAGHRKLMFKPLRVP